MGLFDTVWITCPLCGVKTGAQSKAGDCGLANYTPGDAPREVLEDVAAFTWECRGCRAALAFRTETIVLPQVWATPAHKDDDDRIPEDERAVL